MNALDEMFAEHHEQAGNKAECNANAHPDAHDRQ
jgi:hypothetical protein